MFKIVCKAKQGKEPLVITAETKGKKAYLALTGYISEWNENNAGALRAKISEYLKSGITEAELYISSGGGDVFQATDIVNEIKRFTTVKVFVGALMASAATAFTSSFYSTGTINTNGMIHKPMMATQGNYDEIKAQLKGLKNVQNDYLKMYAKKTGMSEEEIITLWDKGDYWMNAEELLEKKFIDAVEQKEVTANLQQVITACTASTSPPVTTKSTENYIPKMDKAKIIALLGLSPEATDEQIYTAMQHNRINAMKFDQLEKDRQKVVETQIEAKIDKAIAEKRITADKRASFVALGKQDEKALDDLLGAEQPAVQASKTITVNAKNPEPSVNTIPEDRKTWTYADWRDKDAKGFDTLMDNDPEKANALIQAYYAE